MISSINTKEVWYLSYSREPLNSALLLISIRISGTDMFSSIKDSGLPI